MKRGETIVYSDGKEIARYKSVDESISEIEENVTSTLEEMRRNRLELEKHLRIMREEQESWVKRNRYEMEAARLRSKKKPSLEMDNPFSLRSEGGFSKPSMTAKNARDAAEMLRVNQAYENIRARQENERIHEKVRQRHANAIAEHIELMNEAEAEADEIKIRYMKIMLGGFMTTVGIVQLLLGGSL